MTFLFGPLSQCRFTPGCAAYGLEAIQKHGAWGGTVLTVKRVCRCHPWGDCGHDPVPAHKPDFLSPAPAILPGQSR